MTRIFYAFFLLVGLVISLLLRGNGHLLAKIPYATHYCTGTAFESFCLGQYAVFRVSFVSAVFFAIHLLLSFRMCGPPRFRLAVQSSGFCLKLLAYVVLVVVAFLIPNEFFFGYGYVAAAGAVAFLLIQIFVLLDFAFQWNETWSTRAAEAAPGEERGWVALLVIATLVLTAIGLTLVIVSYVFFHDSNSNLAVTTVTLVAGVVIFALALAIPHASILVSALVFAYASYLNFSALSSGAQSCDSNSTVSGSPMSNFPPDVSLGLSIAIAAVSLLWACISAGGSRSAFTMSASDEEGALLTPSSDDPSEEVLNTSHFTFFHTVMLLASMYFAMLLTSWNVGNRSASTGDSCIDSGSQVMWVKLATQWVTLVLYLWTMIAPRVCPNRDFSV